MYLFFNVMLLIYKSNVGTYADKIKHVKNILVTVHEYNLEIVAQVFLAVKNDTDSTTGKVGQISGMNTNFSTPWSYTNDEKQCRKDINKPIFHCRSWSIFYFDTERWMKVKLLLFFLASIVPWRLKVFDCVVI